MGVSDWQNHWNSSGNLHQIQGLLCVCGTIFLHLNKRKGKSLYLHFYQYGLCFLIYSETPVIWKEMLLLIMRKKGHIDKWLGRTLQQTIHSPEECMSFLSPECRVSCCLELGEEVEDGLGEEASTVLRGILVATPSYGDTEKQRMGRWGFSHSWKVKPHSLFSP